MKPKRPFQLRQSLAIAFTAALLANVSAPQASAETYFWDSNGSDAGFGAAGGTWAVPTVGNATQGWSTDATGATLPATVTTTFSDGVRFGSGSDTIALGTITVAGTVEANTIIYNAGSGPVTLTGGTISLGGSGPQIRANRVGQVIESAIQLGANAQLISGINSGANPPVINFAGEISGSHNVTITTPNTVNGSSGQNSFIRLSAANTYTGNTTITTANVNNRLFVQSFAANALPATTILTLDGGNGPTSVTRNVLYILNGNDQTLAGLRNVARTNRTQQVVNGFNDAAVGTATLTLNNTINSTFGGNIHGTDLSVVKIGLGTQTLTAGNNYSGTTTISGGKLVGVVGGNHQNSAVTVADEDAIYGISVTNSANSWTCKSLTFAAAGILEFNFGAVAPSPSVSPLVITEMTDFTAATPLVDVIVTSDLPPGVYPLATWGAVDGNAPGTPELTVSQLAPGTSASLSVTANTLNLVIEGTAASIVKANNTNDLILGTSWVGGVAPTGDDLAEWNDTVNSANSTILGADLTWSGVKIANPGGLVTIGGANTLSMGAAPVDIDMSEATADLTLDCPLQLTNNHLWNVAADRSLTLNGTISGPFSVTKQGAGIATLAGLHTYTGNTTILAGTVRLAENETLPYGVGYGNVVVNGTLDLNGNSQIVNGLTGTGLIDNPASGTSSTLTVGAANASSTFNGILDNSDISATLDLVKTGSGTLVLGGVNTLAGSVTVTGGTLAFTKSAPFDNISVISLAGGTTLRPDVVNAKISAPIAVGASGTTATISAPSIHGAGGTNPVPFNLDAPISGEGGVRFYGIESTNAYGTIHLNAQSDYAGSTLLTCSGGNMNLFVTLGDDNALPASTVLTIDGGNGSGNGRFCELNLNGYDQTLAGLTNNPSVNKDRTQRIRNSGALPATLTVNNSADFTYTALLGSGGANMGLTKSGTGSLTLAGGNTYTRATTITGGTLALGASNVLSDATDVSIGDATLAIGGGFSDTVSTLGVVGTATINLGAGSALVFANSSGESWSGTLTLTGNFVSGASLRFGTDASGLTPAQLAAISGPGLSEISLNAEGFVTATVASAGYAEWAATNAGGQGPELDFDGDGVANGVEFFLNAAPGFTALPTLDDTNTISWTNGGNIPASAYGTQFVIQISDNLVGWTDVPAGSLTTNTDGPDGSLTYTLIGTAPRFVRLKVMPE